MEEPEHEDDREHDSLSIFSEKASIKQQYRGLEKTVSLFGQIDANTVNDDPFYIEPNTYWAICIDAKVREEEDGTNALILQWQIDDPSSDYHEKKLQDYFTLVDQNADWEDLDSKQKDKVKYLKRRLRLGFGIGEADMNTVSPSQLISCGAFLEIKDGKGTGKNEGKTFSNIREAMTRELFEEKNGAQSQAVNSTLGL